MTTSDNNHLNPTIIVCIDTTNASETALRYACYRAKDINFDVQILAVMESSHKNLLFGSRAMGNDKRQELEKHLNKLIDKIYKETQVMPSISVREGHITTEITKEIKATPNCAMLIFGKSQSSLSDNTVLPRIMRRIGSRINVPVTIVPENLSEEFLKRLI